MTYPAWPNSLSTKKLAVSGYAEDVDVDPTIRTQMDSGPAKERRRFTSVPKTITGQIDTLSSTDVDNLLTFYETTCAWGSIPFTWLHPRTGASVTYKFKKYPAVTSANSPIVFQAQLQLLIVS